MTSRLFTVWGRTLAVLLLGTVGVHGAERRISEKEVPAAILQAVQAKYPRAHVLGYTTERKGGAAVYESMLKDGSHRIDVTFAADGTTLEEEQVVPESELPDLVRKGLAASKYGHAKIKRIERIVKADKQDEPVFEIVVMDGGKTRELVFDRSGNLAPTTK